MTSDYGRRSFGFLRELTLELEQTKYKVKFITLEMSSMTEINKVYRCRDEIPTFHNLTNLVLFSINYNWHLLVNVLKHCPYLQKVALSQGTILELANF
ncbi:hypothetical protein P8452_29071 [Trifolium repens]|nr:hypothetical protein P8452_29071 [Trifolium repens]